MGEISSWHALLALLHLLTGNPLLAPTVVRDPKASLAHEVHRLKEWAALGVNVPRVLWESEEAIALEDSEQALLRALESDGITKAERAAILEQASRQLADLHNQGLYHSRPAIKDMTLKEGRVYLLDFEEDLEGVMEAHKAIVRDAILYLHSLFRSLKRASDAELAARAYAQRAKPALWREILGYAKKYYPLLWLLRPWGSLLGKDAKATLYLLEALPRL